MKKVFYVDNRIDNPKEVTFSQMIEDFYATPESTWEMPFERLFLNHLGSYGSFDTITDTEWLVIHKERKAYQSKLTEV